MGLQVVYFVLSVYGWYEWLHGGERRTRLRVSTATRRVWTVAAGFGLYEGVPLTKRGFFEAPLHPDRILIFQRAIEDECDSSDEIKEELKITLVHEIAHFFGMDDDYLEEIGY